MSNGFIQQLGAALPTEVRVNAFQSNLTGGQRSFRDGDVSTGLTPTYFDLEISDPSGVLNQPVYDSFCIDTDLFLNFEGYDFNNDGDTSDRGVDVPGLGRVRELDPIEFSATVYSSYDPSLPDGIIEQPENLDLINWLINQNFVGQTASNGEVFTVGDVQQAIWLLADNDAGITDDPESVDFINAMFDGFSNTRINEIVSLAQANGEGFIPGFGQKVAVILVPDGNGGAVDGDPDGQVIFAIVDVDEVIEPASLGDKVFFDDDRDGVQDAGEAGVAGVTVTLTGGGADGVIGTGDDTTETTTTDANGEYLFDNLNPGEEYKVTFSDLPDGFEFTTPDAGGNDAADSDADPSNGMTQIVTLAPGEFNPTLDAGIVETLTPDIDIEKFTNGVDADTPNEAVEIAAGETVTWTYEVTNTGEVAFAKSEISVTDDQEGNVTTIINQGNGDNILDPGETWIYQKTGTAQDLSTSTGSEDIRFHLTGNSYTTGHYGNVRTFSQDGVSVDVSAFRSDKSGSHWSKAYLGAYGGGLGVTNQYESGHAHRVDNGGSNEYILFEFDEEVTVDRAFLDYVSGDSDISVWIGNRDGDISHLNSNILSGFTKENNNGGKYDRWADFNASELTGDTLVIAARDDHNHDSFKLKKLDITVPGETAIGTYQNLGTVVAGGVSDSDTSSYTNSDEPVVDPIHYEAEDMHRCYYKVEHVGHAASGGEAVKLTGHSGFVSKNFDGLTGTYDVVVGYFDENDGRSHARVSIDGKVKAAWDWDQNLGSHLPTKDNAAQYVIDDVHIGTGDKIKLSATFNHGEFGRFDYIKFVDSSTFSSSESGVQSELVTF